MENAMMASKKQDLQGYDVRAEKRKKTEDLSLIRECLKEYENRLSNNLLLSAEDKANFSALEESEALLVKEIESIDRMLLEFIAVTKDTLKKSADIMDTGFAVNLDLTGKIKAGQAREIKTRRSSAMMKLDIEVLINLNKEAIKTNSIKSVRALFALIYTDRIYDNSGKAERKAMESALMAFWKGLL